MNVVEWPLQEAKNRLSEVIKRACDPKEGPQTVTRHGKKTVVILAYDEYKKLCTPQASLTEFFRFSPLAETEIDVARDRSQPRTFDL